MTPPTLPETVARLAEQVPSLLMHEPKQDTTLYVRGEPLFCRTYRLSYHGGWSYLHVNDERGPVCGLGLRDIEYALREEIEARGWTVVQRIDPPSPPEKRAFAAIYFPDELVTRKHAYADFPAHALSLALLRALERGEK